jgi:hypothetical protein
MFENRVLRRIIGLERDEVAGGWRKLHNEELHSLCYLHAACQLLVTANVVPSSPILVNEGGAKFLQNVGYYKSHTA